jgi:hypothetical protein
MAIETNVDKMNKGNNLYIHVINKTVLLLLADMIKISKLMIIGLLETGSNLLFYIYCVYVHLILFIVLNSPSKISCISPPNTN